MSYIQQPIPIPKKQEKLPVVPYSVPPPMVPVRPNGEWNPADVPGPVPSPMVAMPSPAPQVAQPEQQPEPAAAPSFPDLPGPEKGEFSKGLSAAWQGFKGGVGGVVEAAGAGAEKLGLPGAGAVKEYGKGVYQQAAIPAPSAAPKVASLGEVKLDQPGGWGRLKDWSEFTLGQGLGSLGLLAGGAAAGAVAGVPGMVGMGVGAGVTALGSEFGKLTEEGVPVEKALPAAAGIGAINGALMATPWGAASRFLGIGAKEAAAGIAETIAKDSALSSKAVELAGKVLKGGAAGTAVGGGITGLSELVNLAGERWAKDNPVFAPLTDEDWSRFKESVTGGGLTGLAAGGALGPFEGAGKKAAPEQLTPEQAAVKASEEVGWEKVRAAQGKEPEAPVEAGPETPKAPAKVPLPEPLSSEQAAAEAPYREIIRKTEAGEALTPDEKNLIAGLTKEDALAAESERARQRFVAIKEKLTGKVPEAVRKKFVEGQALTAESTHLSGAKPELEDLGAWASTGGSASEMLDYLSNQKKMPFESTLGRMLKAAGVGDAKIVLEKDYPVAGRYVAQDHTIHLDSTLSLADMGRTFVHEAVHAATLRAIHLTADSAPVRSLQGIFDHVSKTAMKDFGAGSPLEAAIQHGKGMLYGLKNLDEFVSEAFTNPEFQAYLKTIKMPGEKGFIATAWEHFVEALRQALGLKPGDRSALADALEAGTKVMERQARAMELGRAQGAGAAGMAPAEGPVWVNKLADFMEQKLPGSGMPEAFGKLLDTWEKGGQIKKEELEWSGVREWLAGQEGKVKKEDLINAVREGQVKVGEVVKGKKQRPLTEFSNPRLAELFQRRDAGDELTPAEIREYNRLSDEDYAERTASGETKFSQYQLPGGENYRELLLTLPKKKGEPVFKSPHFDEPNILAHVRMNDRVDTEGKKVLFLEEVQSDWHQKGRKEGYRPTDASDWIARTEAGQEVGFDTEQQANDWLDRHGEAGEVIRGTRTEGVPNAPFKSTWPMLAFKRALREAAEKGYDKIAWTTGEQQAERYDLSKHIDSIDWSEKGDERLWSAMMDGEVVLSGRLEEAEANLGKEIAEKLASAKGDTGQFTGLDLKVGGKGMKEFYDKMLPSEVNKYVKKWGGKVGETKVRTISDEPSISETRLYGHDLRYLVQDNRGKPIADFVTRAEAEKYIKNNYQDLIAGAETVHSLEITPKMREAVLEGQSAFLFGGEKAEAPRGGLKEAKEWLAEGQDPQLVRQITGWHQGVDGKWRFEIDDSKAKLKTWTEPEYSDEVKELERLGAFRTPDEDKAYERLKLQAENAADWMYKKLLQVLDHPTIFDQYPELKDVVVTKGELPWAGGLYSPSKKEITITPTLSKATALNVMLHEIQHWIQFKEDFAQGGMSTDPKLLLQGLDKIEKRTSRVLALAGKEAPARVNAANKIKDRIDGFKESGDYQALKTVFADIDHLDRRWNENYRLWKTGELTTKEANAKQAAFERENVVLKDRLKAIADRHKDLMYEAYSQLAGEVEARDVQMRQYYSEGSRERVPPGRDVDVRPEEQLIRLEGQPIRGEPTPGPAGQPIHRINEDLEAQTKWLTDEAVKAGYKDPGELFLYEPNKFVELAGQWRLAHPEEDGFLPSPGLEKFSVARALDQKLGVMDRLHEAQEGFLSSRFDRLGFFNQAYLDIVDKFGGLTKELKDDSPEFKALKQAVASRMDQAQAQRAEAIQEVKTRYEAPLREKFKKYKDLDVENVGLQYAARHIVEDGINKALAERNAFEYLGELIPRLSEEDGKALEARRAQIGKAKTKEDLLEKTDRDRLSDWEPDTPLTDPIRRQLWKELMDEFVGKEVVKEGTSPLETLKHEWTEFKDHASGLSTGEGSNVHHVPSASKIYEDAKKDKRLPEIWALLDQANLHALDVRLASGLINKAQYEAMRADKAFYAPLRRAPYVAEEEALSELGGVKGGGKNLRVRTGTHLPGHEPTMVVQNSLAALEATVAAGQANMARRYMAEMVGKLPDEWEKWFSVGLGEEFPYYDKHGSVKHTAAAGMNQKPFDIPFYQDGKLMLIKPVESNSRATSFAAAVMNLNPWRAAGPMKLMQKANSWIRMVNVAASPAFLLSNAIKDPLTAALNLQAGEAKGYVGSIFREYGASMRALRKAYLQGGLEKAIKEGTEDPDLLRVINWQKAGGQITHVQALRQMTTAGLSFEKMVSQDRNAVRQWGKTVTDFIENANTMMESVMRLSTYSVLTRSKKEGGAGLSPMKASQFSRDVTTNFLRSGFKSSAVGGFYLFFNATVQGNRQVLVNLMKSKRLQSIVAGTIAFSAAVDMLGRAMGAEDQDGDGRNDWDQIPAYEKERNLFFPFRINGTWVKIPAPWVYNVFWRAGQLLNEPFAGVEGKSLPGAFADIARLTGASMNPVQSGTWAQEASPTVLDPFVQVWENKDFTGRPLSPTPFPGQARASSWLSFESTPKWAKDLARWANEQTGGDIARSGLIDIAPANLQVIHDAIGGGITRFGEQVFGAAWDKVNGKETETKDFPVLRQFLTTPGNYVESQLYHERIAQVQAADQALRAYTEGPERNLLKARDVRVESAGLLRMKEPMLAAEKEIKSLRLRARLAENRGDDEGAKVFKDKMNKEQQRFNRLWTNRVGA